MEQTKIPIELASVLGVDNSTDAVKKVTSLSAENLTLKSRAESLENELNAEKEKIKTFEKQIEEQKKQTIDDFIENSIKEGRIQVAMKEKFIKLANADFETTKGIILGMSKPPKLSTIVNGGTQTQSTSKTETEEDRSSWDYMTWAKKDSKGLEAMKKDQPEVFNILVETYKNKK